MRNYADITLILDRSGSMVSIREATIEGVNSFIREQQSVPGEGCFSLVQFDDRYQVTYVAIDQRQVPLLDGKAFKPGGGTALVDAVCRAIDDTGRRLENLPESQRPDKVLIAIMTDGEENASRYFSAEDLFDRITHQREKYGWKFVFLGANQDAIATAAKYGIPRNSVCTYQASDVGTQSVMKNLSSATRDWKLDGNNSASGLLIEPQPPAAEINLNVTVNS